MIVPWLTTSALATDTVVSVDTTQDGGTDAVTDDTVLLVTAPNTGPISALMYAEAG